jgi:hypothetical protein
MTQPAGIGSAFASWSIDQAVIKANIFPTFGQKFAGGKAASLTFSVACGTFECSTDYQEHIVQLSRR